MVIVYIRHVGKADILKTVT